MFIFQVQISNIEYKLQLISDSAQPDQRTQQWYEFIHSLITASSAWKVFDSQAVLNSLIYEKCSPCRINDQGNGYVNTESPLHWGHKYEPLSILLYESKYKTEIGEYGCILHKQYGFLGASPDGINIQKSNERFGRMLEIKNIVNREITKIPKKEYWIQMQLQMEVCDLNEFFLTYKLYDKIIITTKQITLNKLDFHIISFLTFISSSCSKSYLSFIFLPFFSSYLSVLFK